MHPSFISVTSSNIEGYYHLAERDVLLIAFKSGGTYGYVNVPSSVALGFINAPSKGKFFAAEIRDRYETTKLDEMAVANVLGGLGEAKPTPPMKKRKSVVSLDALILHHPVLSAIF